MQIVVLVFLMQSVDFHSASQSGNVGIVHFAEKESDLNWLIDVGPDAPYVVLLPPDLFRRYICL